MEIVATAKKVLIRFKTPLQLGWVLLILTFIGVTLYSNGQKLVDYDWHINPVLLLYALFFALLRRLWGGVQWAYLISALSHLSFLSNLLRNLKVYFITNLGSYLPGSLWYIPWRAQINKELGIGWANTSVASVIETTLLLISGAIIGLPVLWLVASSNQVINFWLLLAIIGLGLLAIHPWSIQFLFRALCYILNRQLNKPELNLGQMSISMSLMLMMWLTGGASLSLLIGSLDSPLNFKSFLFVTGAFALAWVVGFLTPFAPSGIGIREGLLTWLFSFQLPLQVATVAALASRFLFIFEDIGWVLIVLFFSNVKTKMTNLLIFRLKH
jgi:glycosyltransferase 2 family protein